MKKLVALLTAAIMTLTGMGLPIAYAEGLMTETLSLCCGKHADRLPAFC